MTNFHDAVKYTVDTLAAGVAAATLIKWLPPIAAVFTIIWYAINAWEKLSDRKISSVKWVKWLFGKNE